MTSEQFFESAWNHYEAITPDAKRIHNLLQSRGERIINDHVAFRTFNIPGIDRGTLGAVFEQWGFKRASEELEFPEKKLKASYWIHPNPNQPKVFISELLLEEFPGDLREWVHSFASRFLSGLKAFSAQNFLERTWEPVRWEDYARFYPISEYAAWTAAFGIQANHFTVLVNSLRTVSSLEGLNDLLVSNGFNLNSAGSVIKGSPSELLEQSSTLANRIEWLFDRGVRQPIMSCYYEFARRYPVPGTNELFQGFIPKSADKIFESNFERKTS